eukprot:scaffold2643_cov73-Phaeocystis_antarctica.AAC.1
MSWEYTLAWACRLAAGAIDLRGGRPARGGDYWELRQHLLGASSPRRMRPGCFEPEIGARSSARVGCTGASIAACGRRTRTARAKLGRSHESKSKALSETA